MHIRILVLISVRQAVDDLPGLLSRGGVIQINKRLSIGALRQDREIGPHRLDVVSVERPRLDYLVHVFAFMSRERSTRSRPCDRARQRAGCAMAQRAVCPRFCRWPPHQKPQATSPSPRCSECPATANKTPVQGRATQPSLRARTTTSSAKISNSGFLIHLRAGREKNSLRLHRAIGLLRRFLNDNLSLKHSDRVIVDNRAIEFAARPSRRGMNDLQRRVGASGAVDKP